MEKGELYIGMPVKLVNTDSRLFGESGTIIDLRCKKCDYDCLIEFDKYIFGHDGLGWGTIRGKEGHCYWFNAADVEEIIAAVEPTVEAYGIDYDALFN